ncbi:glycoside hydrolase family 15 protein [Pseudonocardia acidicola]|uniref:Glycoside hydrolase family 15 protein n=1 Tax=Pseudonocardia acidicola TaxID=2724939 RepID=A0ABX1SC06_9PSEU|nr:glycoside hydrolase family 15 protein [Pseudonocardia acidicola]NMH98402.1 glycoside hydrolase family 15 protein [Pseudonocardia acidicola]
MDSQSQPHVLREYTLLADGERGALVGPHGDVAWMCAPRWDSDAVFSSLIGGRGCYAVTPTGRFVWGGYYEEGSLIWRSRWVTETGIVECREALAFPGDAHRAVILRRIVAVQGGARVEVTLEPAAGFGRRHLRELHRDDEGRWEGRVGDLRLRFSGGAGAAVVRSGQGGRRLVTTIGLREGAHHDLVLELSDGELGDSPPEPDRAWAATEAAWHEVVSGVGETLAPRDARRSYAVLRGLTGSGGGMVAAATMSLPERAEQGRNYDYRYVWIRDQCYAGQAVSADGPHPLLDDAVRFVAERILADGPDLKPAYTIAGVSVPDERSLNLPGYPGGYDIVGNHANAQFQLDAFGEALLLFAAAARHDHLGTDHHKAVIATVAAIEQRWCEPDAGIWELDDRHWTHSRLTCAAGLRAIAAAGAAAVDAAAWSALADAILADAAADCLHPAGHWQRAPGDPRVDAALLLPAIRGALPATDSRSLATLDAVERELADDGYLYRFRHDARPLGEAEGAFVLCGFLMALARHQVGDAVAAVRWFERNRAACGPPGLFSEEYDVAQRQLRGNLPQAFVHALMFETSARLARPWQDTAGRPH